MADYPDVDAMTPDEHRDWLIERRQATQDCLDVNDYEGALTIFDTVTQSVFDLTLDGAVLKDPEIPYGPYDFADERQDLLQAAVDNRAYLMDQWRGFRDKQRTEGGS